MFVCLFFFFPLKSLISAEVIKVLQYWGPGWECDSFTPQRSSTLLYERGYSSQVEPHYYRSIAAWAENNASDRLKEVFRLIVATIDEIRKPFMNYRNDLDECLTFFNLFF